MDIYQLSALELGKQIKEGAISVEEAVKAVFSRIHETEDTCQCYITLCEEQALLRAKEVQKAIQEGSLSSPLAGVPMAVKDNLCTKGIETTCGSLMLKGFRPFYTATAVKKLEDAGAILIGKLNMDEFAMGSTTETSFFHSTKNPWNIQRAPGGSSGGSAAAVAAQEAFYTLGSDTGGSIRQPASFCGVTGLKPTYGTVSRYGLVAYASSLDQIGPIGKNAADVAQVFSTISGRDPKDSTSMEYEYLEFSFEKEIKGKRIGIPLEYLGKGLHPEVEAAVLEAAEVLEKMGAQVERFPMPQLEYAIPAYYIIACAEASSNLSRYDGVKYGYRAENYKDLNDLYNKTRTQGFGTEVKRRLLIGAFVLSSGYYEAYYKKALQVKALLKGAFDQAFEKYDVILSPTAPTTAPKLGESLGDPLKMYLGDIYTVSVNLAGLPAISLPCGFDKAGLPIGVQLIGRPFAERTLLQMGYAYQQETDFHLRRPQVGKKGEAVL